MCTEVYKHTCVHSPSPPTIILSSKAIAQPIGISKKNRFSRHDAALGSETQPTPAGSKSGRDEEKRKERECERKKKRR